MLSEPAPAKVNLTLKVLGRRTDGYHELDSLVAFADCGERVELMPGDGLGLVCCGPFAAAIDGADSGNLILKAARLARLAEPRLRLGQFRLDKHLPVAAGVGGGSSDAAAALRLIQRANPELAAGIDWQVIAARCGADVPVCLVGRAARMNGLGERLTSIGAIPPLGCVLVNPGVPLATAPVFKALAAPLLKAVCEAEVWPTDLSAPASLMALVAGGHNDLEAPAVRLCPPIADVKAVLASVPGIAIARMSGSGPTCFGLCASLAGAQLIAAAVRRRYSDWWVAAAALY